MPTRAARPPRSTGAALEPGGAPGGTAAAPLEAEVRRLRAWIRAAVVLSALAAVLSAVEVLGRWTGRTASLETIQAEIRRAHDEDARDRQALSRELKDQLKGFWEDLTGKH